MHETKLKDPQKIVENAMPLAREILRGGFQLTAEIVSMNSYCTEHQYSAYLSNAVHALTAAVTQNLKKGH